MACWPRHDDTGAHQISKTKNPEGPRIRSEGPRPASAIAPPLKRNCLALFLAGQGPRDEKGAALTGKLGAEISIDEGYRRARLVGLGLLAAIRDALGSLDRVDFIVKLLGMVNAVPNFNDMTTQHLSPLTM